MTNYISRPEIEELSEALIRQYHGKLDPMPCCVDIDGFVQDCLHCSVVYENFAEEEQDKLGFIGDGQTPLKVWRQGQAVERTPPYRTIVLERYLLRPEEHARRRFTLAHEAGHYIAMRLSPDTAACFYHAHSPEREYSVEDLRQRYNILEWQANAFAAALLMPRCVVQQLLYQLCGGHFLPVYGNTVFHPREKILLQKMAETLEISHTALVIRLRELGMLKSRPLSAYIQKELQMGVGGYGG